MNIKLDTVCFIRCISVTAVGALMLCATRSSCATSQARINTV